MSDYIMDFHPCHVVIRDGHAVEVARIELRFTMRASCHGLRNVTIRDPPKENNVVNPRRCAWIDVINLNMARIEDPTALTGDINRYILEVRLSNGIQSVPCFKERKKVNPK